MGYIAVSQMHNIGKQAEILGNSYIPSVRLNYHMEHHLFQAMYNIRAYGFTGETVYLES